jgi:dihydroorotate dehydrogenase
MLRSLLQSLHIAREALSDQFGERKPLFLKIAPDLEKNDIKLIADLLVEFKMDAIIATNTTITRDAVQDLEFGQEAGGLSGAPVRDASTEVIRSLKAYLGNAIPIVGVGGIMSGQDAQEKIAAGAGLVQIYSGLIYRGPKLISECAAALKGH